MSSLLTQKGSTTLDSHTWSQDAVGNPLTETNNGFNASFGFDDLYRITGATDPTGTYSWGYDADNNRLSQVLNGSSTSYTVDTANHLTSVGGVPVTVDANGNLQNDGQGNTYSWDVRGRLVAIQHNGVTTATFQYDTNGIRTSETINGVTTKFTIDGVRCVLDNNATNTNPTMTMFGPAGPFCRGAQYYTPDAAGSIATVTDTSGNHVQHNQYGVFGQQVTDNQSSGNPLGFLGGMSDPNGLVNVGGSINWSPGLGQGIGGSGGGNVVHTAELLPSGYLQQVGQVFQGYGDCLNLVNAVKGIVALVGVAHRQGVLAATSVLGRSLYHSLTDWTSTSDPREFGQSFCAVLVTAATIVAPLAEGAVCFPAGTPVLTAHGAKTIERIRAGDRVLSADPATGRQSYQKVVRTFVHRSSTLLKIVTADGRSVEATPTHPFWVQGKGFVAAKRLARSDLLKDDHGRFVAVAQVATRHGRFTVYNFEVARTHTYYAGGRWVHNACPPAKPGIKDVRSNITDDFIDKKVLNDHEFGAGKGKSEFLPQFSNVQDIHDFIDQTLTSGYGNADWNEANQSWNVSRSFPYAIGVDTADNGLYGFVFAFNENGVPLTAYPE